MAALDQGFRRYNSQLETVSAPFDPHTGIGDEDDPARYVARPGVDFFRPWLAIRNGAAFQWPLGMEGYSLVIDPTLGLHKYIGDNKVVVDVIHAGEEHLTLSGSFPGNSAPDLIQALRDVVYQDAPDEGKILYVPEIMAHAQRVQIVHAEFSRGADARGRDADYSIEFIRLDTADQIVDPAANPTLNTPAKPNRGKSARAISADSGHNTLRKIAAWKLGSSSQWQAIYRLNDKWFTSRNIQMSKAPDFRIPNGTTVYY
jgi:hypothetical protein